ncbi:glycosyltransferase [Paenibacillus sp. NPDC058367]|uniref:glycosyltransferase family 2 protein n=1 Tax=Paenibacillus sp. NPDC058367 TaxID=3346460 RepID=UPI0036482BFB
MPLISIIVPVYNVKEIFLRECIESVLLQNYSNWELCIADDNSSEPHVKSVLEEYKAKDNRIRISYRKENGHISACSNTALELVTGEYTALLDNDDILAPFALHEVVSQINENKDIDLIYSNEDKLKDGIRCFPFFKKKYNKHLLRHMNYICHFAVYRTSLVKKVNGFRVGYEGVQDWDIAIRIMQLTDQVIHIPKILYHWRISETSTAGGEHRKSYVKQSRKKMLANINNG